MKALVESVQLHAGLTESVLNTSIVWEKYVERTWLSYLVEELRDIKGGIVINFQTPVLQRQYGRALREVFSS